MNIHKLAIVLAILLGQGMIQPAVADTANPIVDEPAVLHTKMALRDLWVEHVFWIRNYVLATAADDAVQRDIAAAEVVANAKALAGTITPFYGQAASDQLFTLLGGHWGAVKDYSDATFESRRSDQKDAVDRLTTNARDIAVFLSGANPYLPEEAVFGLLAAHGAHHVSQIGQIESGAFAEEAETWAAMRKHMHVIADAITEALAQQFPERLVTQNQ